MPADHLSVHDARTEAAGFLMPDFQIRNAGGLPELSRWKQQWNGLAHAQKLPMLRYEWFAAAERHLADRGSVRIVYIVDGNENLAAALPLQRTTDDDGRTRYQILGHARLYEPTDVLYRDGIVRRSLLKAVASLGHPIVLSRLWPDEAAPPSIARGRICRHAIEFGKPAAPSQYLILEGDYETYSGRLSSRHRYDLRRAYRRAAEIGNLSVDFTTPGPEDLHRQLDIAFGVEARSWKGVQRSNVTANADLHAFFQDALDSYSNSNDVLIGLLSIDGMPVAAKVCLLAHRRIWILKIGYDDTFHRVSPGMILMNELIRYGHQSGLVGIEFLGSAEDWLNPWCPEMRHYRLMALYPYTLRSLACFGKDIVASALNRA